MIKTIKDLKHSIDNEYCANLYINEDTQLSINDAVIDYDVIDGITIINDIKVQIKREELARSLADNGTSYAPEQEVIQLEDFELLDFKGDWTYDFDDKINELVVDFRDMVVVIF